MWQHDPQNVERALAEAGFVIMARFGELDRSPYVETSKKQVIICEAI
jgi:hypothetical protein